jgi:hypothetical protein
MHWWHAAHFPLWGRAALLERSMGYYHRILPAARETARLQGCAGARWPKMTDPGGRESPSPVGVFLVWQQPHPIFLAELLHRADPRPETLRRHAALVAESADFMASFAADRGGGGGLGPPLIPAQESYGKTRATVRDPAFELAYWDWALAIAQSWRARLGQPPEPAWQAARTALPRPLVRDGGYEAIAVPPFTLRHDHPSMLMALGFLPPGPLVDSAIMNRTFDRVLADWDWRSTWGWDYPVLAMTAARLGRPEDALAALLMESPKNRWLASGHNYQDQRLPIYLPGNGGLLYAAALMAAGWDGGPQKPAPGFPAGPAWVVRAEGLQPAP